MKKSINYILFLTVLSLWGIVGYKTYKNYFQQSNPTSLIFEEVQISNALKIIEKDTFVLFPLDRDPFLSNTLVPMISIKPIAVTKLANDNKLTSVVVGMPIIQYYGYIKSKEAKNEVVLIKIGNTLQRMKKGESFEGVKLHKVFKDSVVVKRGKYLKSYARSQ